MRRVMMALIRWPWVRWRHSSALPRAPKVFTVRMANAWAWYLGPLVLSVPMPYSRVFLDCTARSAPWMLPKKSGIRAALGLSLLLALVGAASAEAQTQVPSPTPPSTRIYWDHDGVNTDRYLLIVDGGTPADLGRPTPVGQTYSTPFPALAPGTHQLVICAENVAGRSCAAPVSVAVVVPTLPTAVRIGTGGE